MKTVKNVKMLILMTLALTASLLFYSCKTLPKEKEKLNISRRILDKGLLTADQLAAFFLLKRNDFNSSVLSKEMPN